MLDLALFGTETLVAVKSAIHTSALSESTAASHAPAAVPDYPTYTAPEDLPTEFTTLAQTGAHGHAHVTNLHSYPFTGGEYGGEEGGYGDAGYQYGADYDYDYYDAFEDHYSGVQAYQQMAIPMPVVECSAKKEIPASVSGKVFDDKSLCGLLDEKRDGKLYHF